MPRMANRGVNDLFTLRPDLKDDWDWEENTVDPNYLMVGANYRAHWVCHECGHKWVCRLDSRTKNNHGCPMCSKNGGGSVPDYLLWLTVSNCFNSEVYYRYNKVVNMELDVFIPELNIGIEYNGSYYHVDDEKWVLKQEEYAKLGITLYFIVEREDYELSVSFDENLIYVPQFKSSNFDFLKSEIRMVCEYIGFGIDADFSFLGNISLGEVRTLLHKPTLEHSLKSALADNTNNLFYDYEKNGSLKPEDVYRSVKYIDLWFKCELGHSFKVSPRHINDNYGCRICKGSALKGRDAIDCSYNLPLVCEEIKGIQGTIHHNEGISVTIKCPFCGKEMNYRLGYLTTDYAVDFCSCTCGEVGHVLIFGRDPYERIVYCLEVKGIYFLGVAVSVEKDSVLSRLHMQEDGIKTLDWDLFIKYGIDLGQLATGYNKDSCIPVNKKELNLKLVGEDPEVYLSALCKQKQKGLVIEDKNLDLILLSKGLFVEYFKERFERENFGYIFALNRTVNGVNSSLYCKGKGLVLTFRLNIDQKRSLEKLYKDVKEGLYKGTMLFTSYTDLVNEEDGIFYIKPYIPATDIESYLLECYLKFVDYFKLTSKVVEYEEF